MRPIPLKLTNAPGKAGESKVNHAAGKTFPPAARNLGAHPGRILKARRALDERARTEVQQRSTAHGAETGGRQRTLADEWSVLRAMFSNVVSV